MHTYFNSEFNKKVIIISPGEYYVTTEDIIIQTVLGSCISVCLFTEQSDLAGMNHFMLPQQIHLTDYIDSFSGKYGMYSMELLFRHFVKNGINIKNLKAKVFGGSSLLNLNKNQESIACSNIKFIISFLDKEKIPIISIHLGGKKARKIYFFIKTRKVMLKEIAQRKDEMLVKEELSYQKKIINEFQKQNTILFN